MHQLLNLRSIRALRVLQKQADALAGCRFVDDAGDFFAVGVPACGRDGVGVDGDVVQPGLAGEHVFVIEGAVEAVAAAIYAQGGEGGREGGEEEDEEGTHFFGLCVCFSGFLQS